MFLSELNVQRDYLLRDLNDLLQGINDGLWSQVEEMIYERFEILEDQL